MTYNSPGATTVVASLGGLLAAALVSACSPLPPYEATAADLARTGRGTSADEFATRGWHLVVRESNVASR